MGSLVLAHYSVMLGCGVMAAGERPLRNVVVILSDDHALKVTGAYGNSIVRTPSIDRLASEGVTFDRAYCNAPICSASRQSLLTGKYPHATGVNLLFTPFRDDGNVTIAEHLRGYGYRTAIIGKTHWNNWAWETLYAEGPPDHGFDTLIEKDEYFDYYEKLSSRPLDTNRSYYRREAIERSNTAEWMNWQALPHPVRDAESMGVFFAKEAVRFMEESRDQPFFLWLAFREPHAPYYFPLEFEGKYDPNDMPLPEGSPEDDRWIPEKFRGLSDAERRGIIAAYYTSTEYMDRNMGMVLDAIDRLGLKEETLVLYLSDNGYLLHEHKRFEKHTMWEEAIRQPMIVRAGDANRSGERVGALVEYVDVAPTILDLVGIQPMSDAQGISLREVVEGKAVEHRELTFATYLQDNLAMVCTQEWKYVFHTGSRDLGINYATGYGPAGLTERLYDLKNDPLEQRDVSGSPENESIFKNMRQSLLRRFMETHPDAEDCPSELNTIGKLVWFCEPRDIGDDQMAEDIPTRVFESR